MEKFRVKRAVPEGILVLEPMRYSDERGFFVETYNKQDFKKIGISEDFVQDNQSCSRKGVIRGLHYQSKYPQGKLVRVLRGAIYDVMVDIRRGSPHYGKFFGITLGNSDHTMLYIPVGFAHGFLSLEDHTEVHYKTTDYYHPEYDAGIFWNDPSVGIPWPMRENGIDRPLLSTKDEKLPWLTAVDSPFVYPGGT